MMTFLLASYRNFLRNNFVLNKEELAKKIGKRIVHLREKKGWTQVELARVCIKDKQSIERIESGHTNPTIYTLYEVATALEVQLVELFKG